MNMSGTSMAKACLWAVALLVAAGCEVDQRKLTVADPTIPMDGTPDGGGGDIDMDGDGLPDGDGTPGGKGELLPDPDGPLQGKIGDSLGTGRDAGAPPPGLGVDAGACSPGQTA